MCAEQKETVVIYGRVMKINKLIVDQLTEMGFNVVTFGGNITDAEWQQVLSNPIHKPNRTPGEEIHLFFNGLSSIRSAVYCADLTQDYIGLPDNVVDTAYCHMVLRIADLCLSRPHYFFANARKILSPGGTFFAIDPFPWKGLSEQLRVGHLRATYTQQAVVNDHKPPIGDQSGARVIPLQATFGAQGAADMILNELRQEAAAFV